MKLQRCEPTAAVSFPPGQTLSHSETSFNSRPIAKTISIFRDETSVNRFSRHCWGSRVYTSGRGGVGRRLLSHLLFTLRAEVSDAAVAEAAAGAQSAADCAVAL